MRLGRRIALGAATGVLAGLITGLGLIAATGAATARGLGAAASDPGGLIDATHLPPLLTLPGEPVTLRYDVYCAPPGPDPESGAPCDAAGTVFVRRGNAGQFQPLPLRVDPGAGEGRLVTDVPGDVAEAGFSYYAVLQSRTSGAATMLPAGGPLAPMRSRVLEAPVVVELGTHVFGKLRHPSARVASAGWGAAAGQVGLEQGPQLQPIGGASFDIGPGGLVVVLDEANRRVLRFAPGRAAPSAVSLGVRGTIADLAVGQDGGMTVLETVGDAGQTPLVRRFDASGRSLGATHVAETASAVDLGDEGPVVLGYPGGEWLPVTERGTALPESAQRRGGRPERRLANGDELVVEREGGEARIAEIGPAGPRRSWRILSDTPLGEVQLAKPVGADLVVVLRVAVDSHDEFEVLLLDGRGVVAQFAVAATAWAETAPLARFRLRGTSLYELGSTPAGVFVDRYDVEPR